MWAVLEKWCVDKAVLVADKRLLLGGDLLLLVSCTQIVSKEIRDLYTRSLVIHESDLPEGRGWSPLAWQILEGRSEFTVSLIECSDPVDSGRVVKKIRFSLEGHELSDEINQVRDRVRLELMDYAIAREVFEAQKRYMTQAGNFESEEQFGVPTYYERRFPEDSRLDPGKSIAEQFDLLRICDSRFPAFFEHRGHRYTLTLKKS